MSEGNIVKNYENKPQRNSLCKETQNCVGT